MSKKDDVERLNRLIDSGSKIIFCKLFKCGKLFLPLKEASAYSIGDSVSGTLTARYYKGIGAHHDGMVIHVQRIE